MEESLAQVVSLLAIAMVVALGARRLSLPYTVGLVAVGLGLALSKSGFGLPLTHDLIFDLILPPLLFEAALSLSWRELRRDLAPILVLSTLGAVLAAALVGGAAHYLLGWPATSAIIFGVLISATDPVAVIAMFKDNGVEGRIRRLVESESLFNDGAAAVMFTLALAWAQSDAAMQSGTAASVALLRISLGGVAVGVLCGGAAMLVARGTSEHLIEAALTTVAAYGSFLLAERLEMSGVLATVATGLVLGNLGVFSENSEKLLTSRGRDFLIGFWEFAAFLANSIVFLLIGVNIAVMPFSAYGATEILAAIAIVLMGRALTVYPLCLLFWRSQKRVSWREQHVLFWGGLRGALALALALSLPHELPLRVEIVTLTFGVVAFSILIQGLTMPPLLRRLGFLGG